MEGTLPFLLVVLLAGGTVSKRHSRKTQSPLENWQKQFLQKIRGVAQQSGLSESELNAITKYDKDVCYERACLESGKIKNSMAWLIIRYDKKSILTIRFIV